jgi:hypothetical protein
LPETQNLFTMLAKQVLDECQDKDIQI